MSALQDSHASTDNGKSEGDFDCQLSHVLLDVDVFSKPKMKAMRVRFGALSHLWFIHLVMDMSRASHGAIDECLLLSTASDLGIANAEELIAWAFSEEIFIKNAQNKITNSRVQKDREKLKKKRDSGVTRQQRHRDRSVTQALHARDSRVFPDTVSVSDTVIVFPKEGGVGGERSPTSPPNPELTEDQKKQITETIAALPLKAIGLDGLKPVKCLKLWARHCVLNLKKPFEPITAEALVARYAGRGEDFSRDVLESVARGWKGVYPAREGPLIENTKISPKSVRGFSTPAELLKKMTEMVPK